MKTCACGSTEFYDCGRCKKCVAKHNKKYYQENKAKKAEYQKNNKEKIAAQRAASREINKVAIAAATAAYYRANKEKISEQARARNQKNKAKNSEANKAYRLSNPGRERARQADYRIKNIEKLKEKDARRAKEHPELSRIKSQNRKARKLAVGGRLSNGLAQRLMVLQKRKCACCRKSLDDGYHMDHNIPLALGGLNDDSNIQLLCPPCNLSKSAKHPIEFMQQRGFLL